MKRSELTLLEVGLITGTRGCWELGLLLLADRLSEDQRKVIRWTLILMGVVSTMPPKLVMDVFSRGCPQLQPLRLQRSPEGSSRFHSQPGSLDDLRGHLGTPEIGLAEPVRTACKCIRPEVE